MVKYAPVKLWVGLILDCTHTPARCTQFPAAATVRGSTPGSGAFTHGCGEAFSNISRTARTLNATTYYYYIMIVDIAEKTHA